MVEFAGRSKRSEERRRGNCPPDLNRNHGAANFVRFGESRHFRCRTWARNRLATFHKRADMLGRKVCDISHGVLFVASIRG